jgi:hypothetical protein
VGVAFLGFVAVSLLGGPNWQAKMEAADLKDYSFEASGDEIPTWTVKRVHGGDGVGGATKIAPKAIEEARKDLKSKQVSEADSLEKDLKYWQDQLAEARKFTEQDAKGVELRLKELDDELAALNKKIEEVSAIVTERAQQVRAKQAEADRRLEDIRLYEAQLEELRTDRFRALEQQKILRDQLIRFRGTNDRLQRRNDQLKQELNAP